MSPEVREISDEQLIGRVQNEFEKDSTNTILMNRLAIAYLETNQYEEALAQFENAVHTRRTIQALNNCAWFYMHEGEPTTDGSWMERVDKAIVLLEEAVKQNPTSDFPYRLLGEAYLREKRYEQALQALNQAVKIDDTSVGLNNLGVALYFHGDFKQASEFFRRAANLGSEPAKANLIMALLQVPNPEAARHESQVLAEIAIADPHVDYYGPLEVAQFFYALKDFQNAVHLYQAALPVYWKDPTWFAEYIYSLTVLNRNSEAEALVKDFIDEKTKHIVEIEKDPDWDNEEDRQDNIHSLQQDINQLQESVDAIRNGWAPSVTFEPCAEYGCYLFGCTRHGHDEYHE
jgi:tetratricopeptide (TPR) repeat protein